MKNLKVIKDDLRNKYRTLRMDMSADEKNDCDRRILERLTGLYQYSNVQLILTYVSIDMEVDTRQLIEKAWTDGKYVAVPKCTDSYELEFYFIKSADDLEISTFGLLEPKTEQCRRVKNYNHALCVVPGMCFDTNGYRIGYGKGYYDRFLSDFTGTTAGLCYSKCVEWNLPKGYYDRPVDILVTDRYFRRCNSQHEK